MLIRYRPEIPPPQSPRLISMADAATSLRAMVSAAGAGCGLLGSEPRCNRRANTL